MRTVPRLLATVVGVLAVAVCGVYLWMSSRLPKLESELDLYERMKDAVEGERMSLGLGQSSKQAGDFAYEKPDFSRLPRDLVSLHLTQLGCATYFQTPREEGLPWSWRIFDGAALKGRPIGDGRCERYFALRIAEELGIGRTPERDIAARKIHAVLGKDQLVAWALSGELFARGVVGIDAAAQKLFRKPLGELPMAQLAELSMALYPLEDWDELVQCRNPSALRQTRDDVLQRVLDSGLVPADRVRAAQAQPLSCAR